MPEFFSKILSRDSGPFWQFAKYGTIGVLSTAVQAAVFYALASTALKCLTPDDWAVVHLGLPAAGPWDAQAPWHATRGSMAAAATAIGFTAANVFCYAMNRRFVFTPGRFRMWAEFSMFFGCAAAATAAAIAVMKVLIDGYGVSTSFGQVVEIVLSFAMNFAARKFLIFKR